MTEFFFILAVIFIAYMVFNKNKSDDGQSPHSKEQDGSTLNPPGNKTAKAEITTTKPTPAKKTQAVKPKPKTRPKAKATKQAAPKIELRTVIMKNPATGEEAKVAGSYRMVKRWIKEALVEEGLLEKIYKNNELDDAAKVVVAEALSIIKAMDRYKA